MITTSKAIVLRKINYADSSVIVKAYTQNFGLHSYMLKGFKKAKKKTAISSLALVKITARNKENTSISTCREITCYHPYTHILFDVAKSTIAIFISEVLYKTIKEETPNPTFFNFVEQALIYLDSEEFNPNFTVAFLMQLTQLYGIAPTEINHHYPYFDLANGICTQKQPEFAFLTGREKELFVACCGMNFVNSGAFTLTRDERNQLLRNVLDYYRIHLDGISEWKSLKVLETVFSVV